MVLALVMTELMVDSRDSLMALMAAFAWSSTVRSSDTCSIKCYYNLNYYQVYREETFEQLFNEHLTSTKELTLFNFFIQKGNVTDGEVSYVITSRKHNT